MWKEVPTTNKIKIKNIFRWKIYLTKKNWSNHQKLRVSQRKKIVVFLWTSISEFQFDKSVKKVWGSEQLCEWASRRKTKVRNRNEKAQWETVQKQHWI